MKYPKSITYEEYRKRVLKRLKELLRAFPEEEVEKFMDENEETTRESYERDMNDDTVAEEYMHSEAAYAYSLMF